MTYVLAYLSSLSIDTLKSILDKSNTTFQPHTAHLQRQVVSYAARVNNSTSVFNKLTGLAQREKYARADRVLTRAMGGDPCVLLEA